MEISQNFVVFSEWTLKSNDFLFMTFLFELQAPYKTRETELLLAAFFSEEDSTAEVKAALLIFPACF